MTVQVTEQLTFPLILQVLLPVRWESPDAFSILPDVLNRRTPPCHVSSAAVPSILIKGLELPNPTTLYLILPVFENDLVFVLWCQGLNIIGSHKC